MSAPALAVADSTLELIDGALAGPLSLDAMRWSPEEAALPPAAVPGHGRVSLAPPAGTVGIIYLLHFCKPYRHASHYRGWTTDLPARLAEHAAGHGANLLKYVRAAGITWTLARTWQGTRDEERRLKNTGGAARYCPLCGVNPRGPILAPLPAACLPRNRDGSVSRRRTTDAQKAAAGLMTAAQLAEHTALRQGCTRGRVTGVTRLGRIPDSDPWYRASDPPGERRAAAWPGMAAAALGNPHLR